jgi:hypothetical protein
MAKEYWVADLSPAGELRLKERYEYAHLDQLDQASGLITHFATLLWRSPDEFETPLPASLGGHKSGLRLRWRASAETTGIATLRWKEQLASISFLVSGQDAGSDVATLGAFQQHLLRELRDTPFEPAFGLAELVERPLVASIHFQAPDDPADRAAFALTDRCFAAAYFRRLGLA